MLTVSSLLSSLNYASVDIADDEGSFKFSPKAESRHTCMFTCMSPLQ